MVRSDAGIGSDCGRKAIGWKMKSPDRRRIRPTGCVWRSKFADWSASIDSPRMTNRGWVRRHDRYPPPAAPDCAADDESKSWRVPAPLDKSLRFRPAELINGQKGAPSSEISTFQKFLPANLGFRWSPSRCQVKAGYPVHPLEKIPGLHDPNGYWHFHSKCAIFRRVLWVLKSFEIQMLGDDFDRIAQLITNQPTDLGLELFLTPQNDVKVGGKWSVTWRLRNNFGRLFLDVRFLWVWIFFKGRIKENFE